MRLATAGLSRVRLADTETLLSSTIKRQTMDIFLGVLERIPTDLTTALTAAYFTHSELQRTLIQTSLLEMSPDPAQTTNADEIDSTAEKFSGNTV